MAIFFCTARASRNARPSYCGATVSPGTNLTLDLANGRTVSVTAGTPP